MTEKAKEELSNGLRNISS